MTTSYTGGCQCGAVRYRFTTPGRASVCHCRMCQKAVGNYFLPLVEVEGFEWTRGKPARFASSNLSYRAFCSHCGTPLTLETDEVIEVGLGTLDQPFAIALDYQVNVEGRPDFINHLHTIPDPDTAKRTENDAWNARIESYQHPDHDTEAWEPKP